MFWIIAAAAITLWTVGSSRYEYEQGEKKRKRRRR